MNTKTVKERYQPPKLRAWNEFTEEVVLPAELTPAISSGRPELLNLARRDMTAEEVGQVLNLVRVLIDTNQALQMHSQHLAIRLEDLSCNLGGVTASLSRLSEEAEFRRPEEDDDSDD